MTNRITLMKVAKDYRAIYKQHGGIQISQEQKDFRRQKSLLDLMMKLVFWVKLILIFVAEVFTQEIEYYHSEFKLNKLLRKARRKDINVGTRDHKHSITYVSSKMRYYNTFEVDYKTDPSNNQIKKRAIDPVFHGRPKTQEEIWNERFINKSTAFDQTPSLIRLLHNITLKYLNECTPVVLYDSHVEFEEDNVLEHLFKIFPVTYAHGRIDDNDQIEPKILVPTQECLHFIIFLTDVKRCAKVIGLQATSKVVIVARSSQWAVQEFLASPLSRKYVNLLVIGQTFKDDDDTLEAPYILYTHKLYTDGLGASKPVVLTSWSHGKYSRNVNLFPPKMTAGYAGHRFVVAAANQPPYVFRRIISDADGGNPRVVWDGTELRILQLLAARNNFSIEIIEPKEATLGPGDAVSKEILMGRADVGVAGMYLTKERAIDMDMSFSHSQDCAAFITLMSTALPRYRAILGPFHWHVWVALTFTYLIAIFPLAFSDKHTLRHLIHNSGEVENMFWYVFGTFTNCFTFVGKNSWSKTSKITTRLLIGWYWIFTIIITSCYTGSIIAFVKLPVFPSTVDTIDQLLKGFYRIGTLDRGGWERWFFNSSDSQTNKLLRKMEFVPNVAAGIRNTTKAFFWPYAFLGSQAELEYIVQANFSTTKSKRAALHISNECFVPFGVSMAFPNQSLYTAKLNGDIRRMIQSGLIDKISNEVRWEMQRSSNGLLLSAGKGSLSIVSIEEKGLTLEDTQGMFLLLAAGFLIAAGALISEWMGGCSRKCSWRKNTSDYPSSASSRNTLLATPKTNVDSEIKVISDDDDSRLDFGTPRSKSRNTLEGEIINVTQENIIVHEKLDVNEWGTTRRSSSPDVDREVQAIFERDLRRRRGHSIAVTDLSERVESGGASVEHVATS